MRLTRYDVKFCHTEEKFLNVADSLDRSCPQEDATDAQLTPFSSLVKFPNASPGAWQRIQVLIEMADQRKKVPLLKVSTTVLVL